MDIVTHILADENSTTKKIQGFFRKYKIGELLRQCNFCREKGISAVKILLFLFLLPFRNRSMYALSRSGKMEFDDNTVYRFKNSIHANWLRFTTSLAAKIIHEMLEPLTGKDRERVLILDDTVFSRNRSKKVELLAKVHDHKGNRFLFGFRMLTLGWSDGNTFLPINSCLLSSADANVRCNEAREVAANSNGETRRKLAVKKATEVMDTLLDEADAAGIKANYLLFDSWFCFPAVVAKVKKRHLDVIAMVKKMKTKYEIDGQTLTISQIYRSRKKRRGRSRYLLSAEVSVVVDGETIPLRLVYVRNRNKRSEYLTLLTTDMTLSEEEVIRIYGKRWGIETCFQVCKSTLRLTTECRSLSYDAMTAQAAIVLIRYMMLAAEVRSSEDPRTMGELFYLCCDELEDITFSNALALLLQLFRAFAKDCLMLSQEQLGLFLDRFFAFIPKDVLNSISFPA